MKKLSQMVLLVVLLVVPGIKWMAETSISTAKSEKIK
jgi:hypothetical protein